KLHRMATAKRRAPDHDSGGINTRPGLEECECRIGVAHALTRRNGLSGKPGAVTPAAVVKRHDHIPGTGELFVEGHSQGVLNTPPPMHHENGRPWLLADVRRPMQRGRTPDTLRMEPCPFTAACKVFRSMSQFFHGAAPGAGLSWVAIRRRT